MNAKKTRAEYLAQQLQKIMDAQGIKTHYQLRKLTGVHIPVLVRYLEGMAKQPDAFMLVKIAKGLGVSVDYLLGTDEPDVEGAPTELAMVEV